MSLIRNFRLATVISAIAMITQCSAAWSQAAPVSPASAASAGSGDTRASLEALRSKIDTAYPDVDSVVVMQRGSLLFEHYQAGSDANTMHAVQSVTKSVLALLVGAALDRGALTSLDQPVDALVSGGTAQATAPAYPPITIRHLLTMTSGFEPAREFRQADIDDPRFLMQRPRRAAPGAQFHYDNLAANLLAIALKSAIRQPLTAFAQSSLFEPLGIPAFDWDTGRNGHELGYLGLRLRTVDMARLGQLVLQQGSWQGRQLVSKAFVAAMVQPQSAGGAPAGLPYGYLWCIAPGNPLSRSGYFASGFGGQLIWVYPPLDLVVATTSTVSEASNSRGQALTLIRRHILPALVPANTANTADR